MSNLTRNSVSSIGSIDRNENSGTCLAKNGVSSIGEISRKSSDSLGNLGRTDLQTDLTYDELPDDMTMDSSSPKTYDDFKKENPIFANTGVNLTRN